MTRELFARFHERDQFIGDWIHAYLAAVQYDEWRAEPFRKIDRLKCLFHRALSFRAPRGGELVAIG